MVSRALACDSNVLGQILTHKSGARQLSHAIDVATFGPALGKKLSACDATTGTRRKCRIELSEELASAWARACRSAPVRAAKEIRLNGKLGLSILVHQYLTTPLTDSFGCAPRIAVIQLVRHPADVLVSNYETPGLEGLHGTIRMPPQRGDRGMIRIAEGEAMCLETLQDLAAGAALRQSGNYSRVIDVAETTDAWRLVRYQDIVRRDPAAVANEIHAWLGLPPAPPGRPAFGASWKAYSTERRRAEFVFGDACEAIAPTGWVYTPPSCALVIADLGLERVCVRSGHRDRPRRESESRINSTRSRDRVRLRGAKERFAGAATNPLCMALQQRIEAGEGRCVPGRGMFCNARGQCFAKGACTLCS